MFKRRIYLDYASLTPIDPAVTREVKKYSTTEYANPASFYAEGVRAHKALEDARLRLAKFLNAHKDEIIFTSGGTEANNLAIIGAIEYLLDKGMAYSDMHVLSSNIEHSSVRECLNHLNNRGVETNVVKVDSRGVVDLEDLKRKIRPNTVIVSVMMVNNEIGTIQPLREIAKVVRQARSARSNAQDFSAQGGFNFQKEFAYPILHTDAAQAPLYLEINTEKLGVDMITLDASKLCGPRGVGYLYKKRNTPIAPISHGGSQESGLRPGTEPLPLIMGMAKAVDLISINKEAERQRIVELRDLFIRGLKDLNNKVVVHGEGVEVAPHIINVSIPGINSEFFVLQLDARSIACSTKSSCLRDLDESYVLKAIGADSKTSVRFSLGRWSKKADVSRTLEVIKEILGD